MIGGDRYLNEQILDTPQAANALVLDINLAVASGNWERLPAIVEREWPRRDDHNAETLLSLAQVAAHQGRSPERALALANLAAGKAPDDPRILVASHWLHFQLGCDDDADPGRLARALELSSADHGPVWSSDFRTFVTEWMPQHRERLAKIEQKWLAGEIPNGVAASLFNVPLTHLLIQMPESNTNQADRRGIAIVPIAFGGRPPVGLRDDWSVGLDISSIHGPVLPQPP